VGGFRAFRARFSAYTSGVVRALINASVNVAAPRIVTVNGTVTAVGNLNNLTQRVGSADLLTSDTSAQLTKDALLEALAWNPKGVYYYGDTFSWNGQIYQCIQYTAATFPFPNNAAYFQVDQRQNKSMVTSSYVSPPAAARLRVEIDLDAYQYRLAESLLAAKQQQEVSDLLFQERQLFLMQQGVSGLYGSSFAMGASGMSAYAIEEFR
jgi:hypothetical protein